MINIRGVLLVFFLLLALPLVFADTGCCAETVYGTQCVEASEENCATADSGGFAANLACENADSICGSGCCVNVDGSCSEGVGKYSCEDGSEDAGDFQGDGTVCSSYSSCDDLCCGDDYFWGTEGECAVQYGDDVEYHGADTYEECLDLELAAEDGCCVIEDGAVCSYVTLEECSAFDGYADDPENGWGFYVGSDCVDTSVFFADEGMDAEGVCGCTYSDENRECDSSGRVIVEVDTCGNEGEEVEDCYEDGDFCSTESGLADCVDPSCPVTFSFPDDSVFADFNIYDVWGQDYAGTWYKEELELGGAMEHGESWCIYEGPVGSFRDRVGTQHYRGYCSRGEVIIEQCASDRSEICVAGYDPDYQQFSGDCVPNNWEEFYTQNYHDTTGDWEEPRISTDSYRGHQDDAVDGQITGDYAADAASDVNEDYPYGASTVTMATAEYCALASFDCELVYGDAVGNGKQWAWPWSTHGGEEGWELYVNSLCTRKKFAMMAADYCGTRGLCGLQQNILGENGKDGGFVVDHDAGFSDINSVGCGKGCFDQGSHNAPAEMADTLQCHDSSSSCKRYGVDYWLDDYEDDLENLAGIVPTFLTEYMIPKYFTANYILKKSAAESSDCINGEQRIRAISNNIGSNIDVNELYAITDYSGAGAYVSINVDACDPAIVYDECHANAVEETNTFGSCESQTYKFCSDWEYCKVTGEVSGTDSSGNTYCSSDCTCDCSNDDSNNPISWNGTGWNQEFYCEDNEIACCTIRDDYGNSPYNQEDCEDEGGQWLYTLDGMAGGPITSGDPPDSCCLADENFWVAGDCLEYYQDSYDGCEDQYETLCEDGTNSFVNYDLYNVFRSIKPWFIDQTAAQFYSVRSNEPQTGSNTEAWFSTDGSFSIFEGDYGGCNSGSKHTEWGDSVQDADIKKKEVSFNCNAWVPSDGTDKCQLCDTNFEDDPSGLIFTDGNGKEYEASLCNKFRCESLGGNCVFIGDNYGSEIPTCVEDSCTGPIQFNDALLDEDVLEELGIEIGDTSDTGLALSEIPVSTSFSFGFDISNYGRCRFIDYEDLEEQILEPNAIGIDDLLGFYGNDEEDMWAGLQGLGTSTPEYGNRECEEDDECGEGYACSSNLCVCDASDCVENMALEHTLTLSLLEGEDTTTYYAWCESWCDASPITITPYQMVLTTAFDPPTDAPRIDGVVPGAGTVIAASDEAVAVTVYTNREGVCRYSTEETDAYDDMENEGSCTLAIEGENSYEGTYDCDFSIPIESDTTQYYFFSCEDIFGNQVEESEVWYITPSTSLEISQTSPEGTLYYNDITLQVETEGGYVEGGNDGDSICSFDGTDFENDWTNLHVQEGLTLGEGDYSYDIYCEDEVGNVAEKTVEFTVAVDRDSSQVEGVYYVAGKIYVLTDEDASCEYATDDFDYGEGEEMDGNPYQSHSISNPDETLPYHIICEDTFGNQMEEVLVDLRYLA